MNSATIDDAGWVWQADPSLTRTLVDFRKQSESFVTSECTLETVASLENDCNATLKRIWGRMAQLGWLGLISDAAHDELHTTALPFALTVAELYGRAALVTPWYASCIDAAMLLLLTRTEVSPNLLESIGTGEQIAAVAHQEAPDELSFDRVHTVATAAGVGSYRLNGQKKFVPAAHRASIFLCTARLNKDDGLPLLISLPADSAGIGISKVSTSSGSAVAQVTLDNVQFDSAQVLAHGDLVAEASADWLNLAALLKSAELLGLGRRALELTLEYIQARVQFGRRLSEFQIVQHHCADMYRDLEQVRILIASAARRTALGNLNDRDISFAKVRASESVPRVIATAHQLHGGIGFYERYPLGAIYRRALVGHSAYGTPQWHRKRLRNLVLSDPGAFLDDTVHFALP
jgi:3-oxochol-4-en-24-oyl-CoA dehydrogenase